MSTSLHKVVAPAYRGLHTRALAPRPLRCFHQTSLASLPRKRNFFTSNQLMSSSDKNDASTLSEEALREPKVSGMQKRKTARISAAKSLRLGSMTKQPKRTSTAKDVTTTRTSDSDETDYRRTISAICVAQSFDMDAVQEILRYHAFELDPDGTGFDSQAVAHARGVNNGDIFVFSSGTVVGWSVPHETLMTLATKQLIRAAELPHVDRLEMEELEFTLDETRDTSYMKSDVVVLGIRARESGNNNLDTTLAKIAFSSGLTRSPKLAVLENSLLDWFQNWKPLLNVLAGDSQHKLQRGPVLKATGQLFNMRSQLNHYSDITDQLPDMFWDSESRLEEYHNQMDAAMDVRRRISILNRRIDYAHENATVLREMVSEKYGHKLEWIIIILITVEVMFELRRVYREEFSESATSEAKSN